MVSSGGIRAGAAYIEFYLKDKMLKKGFDNATKHLRYFSNAIDRTAKKMAGLAAGLAVPLGLAARSFGEFDDEFAKAAAILGFTNEQMKETKELMFDLAGTSTFSAKQVAEGFAELARGGFDAKLALATLPRALSLSRAAGSDLGETTLGLIRIVKSFKKDISEIPEVADILTTATIRSAQSLQDLLEGFKIAGPILKSTGVSLKDTAKFISILANAGIAGSRASTGLARVFKNLASESAQLDFDKFFGDIGRESIQILDASNNMRPLVDILGEMISKTQDLGDLRLRLFDKIFGRGGPAALNLSLDQIEKMNQVFQEVGGTTERVASDMLRSFGRVLSALYNGFVRVGAAIIGAFELDNKNMIKDIADVAKLMADFIKQNKDLIVTLGKVLVASVAYVVLANALVLVINSVIPLMYAFRSLTSIALGAGRGVLFAFKGLGVVLGGLSKTVYLLGANILKMASSGAGAVISILGGAFTKVGSLIVSAFSGLGGLVRAIFSKLAVVIASPLSVITSIQTAVGNLAIGFFSFGLKAIAAIEYVIGVLGSLWTALLGAPAAIAGAVSGFTVFAAEVIATLTVAVKAIAAWGVAMGTALIAAAQAAVAAFGPVFLALLIVSFIGIIAGLGGLIKKGFESVFDFVYGMASKVGSFFVSTFKSAFSAVSSALSVVGRAFRALGNLIFNIITEAARSMRDLYNLVSNAFDNILKSLGDAMGRIKKAYDLRGFKGALDQLKKEFKTVWLSAKVEYLKFLVEVEKAYDRFIKVIKENPIGAMLFKGIEKFKVVLESLLDKIMIAYKFWYEFVKGAAPDVTLPERMKGEASKETENRLSKTIKELEKALASSQDNLRLKKEELDARYGKNVAGEMDKKAGVKLGGPTAEPAVAGATKAIKDVAEVAVSTTEQAVANMFSIGGAAIQNAAADVAAQNKAQAEIMENWTEGLNKTFDKKGMEGFRKTMTDWYNASDLERLKKKRDELQSNINKGSDSTVFSQGAFGLGGTSRNLFGTLFEEGGEDNQIRKEQLDELKKIKKAIGEQDVVFGSPAG